MQFDEMISFSTNIWGKNMNQPKEYLRDRELEGTYDLVNLDKERSALFEQAEETGIGGETLTKLPGLSVLLVALKEGHELEEHSVDGSSTVHVLDGQLELTLEGEEQQVVEAKSMAVLSPGIPHDARALEDTLLLITFSEE